MSSEKLDELLKHYGVKGMRWGVRRELKKLSPGKAREDFIKSYDKKWADKVNKNPKATKVAAMAAKEAKKMTKELNKEYKDQGYSFGRNALRSNNINNKRNKLAKTRYESEIKGIMEASLDKASYKTYGNSPSGFSQVNIKRRSDGTLYAEIGPRSNDKLTKQQIKLTKYDQKQAKKTAKQESKTVKHSAEESEEVDYNGVVWIIVEDDDGFFEDYQVIQEDNQSKSDEDLTHYGIKGMRWGVRKDQVTIRERVDSLKRERQWKKVLNEADNMSTDQINAVVKRIRLENDFKKLIKESKVSKKSDKRDYIQRGQMSDDDLSDKVSRLKAKDSLSKSVSEATKEQREFGERVVNTGSTLALSYATNKTISGRDIYDAITNPQKDSKTKIRDKAVQAIVDSVTNPNR